MAERGSRRVEAAVRFRCSTTWSILGLLTVIAAVPDVRAQVPDSTRALPPDSLRVDAVAADTVQRPPVGFLGAEPGVVVGDTLPARLPMVDATAMLATRPASFVYDLGAFGWPDGWSLYGLNPQRVALLLDGLPFDDLVTGRPRYDLLPLAFLDPLTLLPGRHGAPVGVAATMRAYDVRQPLTELSYRASNTGLKSGMALHTQQRRRSLFGNPGLLGVTGGYGGHASQGEYPGSRLRRGRQLLGRVRYAQAAWSVELRALHNRRYLGAHGGVVPGPGRPFESIYLRLTANVRNPQARRRVIRSDFALTARARLLPVLDEPFTLSAFWTKEFFEYRNPGDTLATRMRRLGGRVQQDLRLGPHRLRLRGEGWIDHIRSSNALADTPGRSRTALHVSARDALQFGNLALTLEGGLHTTGYAAFPTGSVSAAYGAGALRVFAEAASSGQPVAWVEAAGFGRFLQPVPDVPSGRVLQGRAGVTLRGGPFDLTAFGFAHTIVDPLDLYTTAVEDSVVALVAGAPFRQAGVGGDLGWRRDARRGFYLTAQPTLVQFLNPDASSLHARQEAALPSFFGTARFGARYLLFRRDLDLDLYLQGRFWTSMRSRTLHPQTGLFVLPGLADRVFPASGTLDVVATGRIRTATLFIAYENVLSGTEWLVGNLIVPVYPLPERRLRFGVFWPIQN